MARTKRKTVKQQRGRQRRRLRNSATSSTATTATSLSASAPSFDIKSSADVKKALDIMRKHPLTVILVFASWCPHCHTYMERWNKYKSLPNRTSPMIAVEQQQSQELLNEINGENGEPVTVNAFPTVLASTSSAPSTGSSKTNVGTPVNTDEGSMLELLTNGSNAVGNVNSEPTELVESSVNSASNFTESISSTRKATPFVRTSNLSDAIRQAVSSATARRAASAARKRRLANNTATASENESILPAINGSNGSNNSNAERFVKPPKRVEVQAMNGGGCNEGTCGAPSGLIKLSGGGMSPKGSLFEALKNYGSGNYTRKNRE